MATRTCHGRNEFPQGTVRKPGLQILQGSRHFQRHQIPDGTRPRVQRAPGRVFFIGPAFVPKSITEDGPVSARTTGPVLRETLLQSDSGFQETKELLELRLPAPGLLSLRQSEDKVPGRHFRCRGDLAGVRVVRQQD